MRNTLTEKQLKDKIQKIVKEEVSKKAALKEGFKGKDYEKIREIKRLVLRCYELSKEIENPKMAEAFEHIWDAIENTKFDSLQ